MGNEVAEVFYGGCRSAEDVDLVTAKRINKLHGPNPGDELKDLRLAMLAMISILRPSLFPRRTQESLMVNGDKLLALNVEIDRIINEGKFLKREKGWA